MRLTVVELPDDEAIVREALEGVDWDAVGDPEDFKQASPRDAAGHVGRAVAARIRAEALRETAAPAGVSQSVGDLRLMVTVADNPDDRIEWLNALCLAVRAEAVADERQRIVGDLHALIESDRTPSGNAPLQMGPAVGVHFAIEVIQRAAGSVPVATPEPCAWWDGPEDHVYGICNQPKGHQGRRHAEMLADGSVWAEWGGGSRPPAPATRGTATDPWVATPTEL